MAVSMSAVQKMTWASSKPSLGLRFAQNVLSATGNTFEGTVQSVPCAEQVKVVTANLQMHWVNATARPSGVLSVEAFEALFADRVGDHSSMDIFFEFNIGFFVVDLDYFAGRLEAHGYAYLPLRWRSAWDNATYYSILANVPGTTTVVEFIGAAFGGPTALSRTARLVDPARYAAYFDDLGDGATAESYVCAKLSFPSTYPDYASLWMRQSGQQKRAKFPTSKAPISAIFHSFRLIFGRAIISRNGLEAWMLFPERARAEHSR